MQFRKIKIPQKYAKAGKWVGVGFLSLFFIAAAVAFTKREAMLTAMVEKAIAKAKRSYNLNVSIGKYGFSGLSTVSFQNVSVVPKDRDSLMYVQEMSVGVKLLPLIFGDVKLAEVNLKDGVLNVVLKDSISNVDFFFKKKSSDSTSAKGDADLSKLAHNLTNQLLYKIPDNMDVKNLVFKLNDNDTASLKFDVKQAVIDGGDLNSTILVNNNEATWHLNGTLKPGRRQLEVMMYAANKKPVELQYLNNKINGKVSFDTVYTKMSDADYEGNDFIISGSWGIKNLKIFQQRLTSHDVVIPDATFDAAMFVGKNYVGIDSSSVVRINKAVFHPYLKYTLSPNKIYEFKLDLKEQEAQDLLSSFPVGVFETLDGMKASGKIAYNLSLYLDDSAPDSVRFSSNLKPNNFKILNWGKTDLQFMNKEFVYTPYEFGKPMRNIVVGPSNPNFVPLNQVSENYKNAVLTSEDPSFFRHNGFVEEAIRSSIVVNYKAKRFKRGGSTISMQLVKNVFLSRQKTISRKAEEILIVWLLEHNKLVSKQRMFEVYLNIIEMGYNVYGIGEAARHYFGKHASELNVGEGIYLASIVPKPKASLYKFASHGGLKDYMFSYFNFIGNTMARRGLTPVDSAGYGFYNVKLREGLRHLLPKDTAVLDSNLLDQDDDFPMMMQDQSKSLFDRLFPIAKKDTVQKKPEADTVKSRKELRKDRREQRRNNKVEL